MGVEHMVVCHKCKSYIDGHKSYNGAALILGRGMVPTYSDFCYYSDKLDYWGVRMIWFALHHGSCGVEILTDCGDEYYKISGYYEEVCSPEEMEDQRKRLEKPAEQEPRK